MVAERAGGVDPHHETITGTAESLLTFENAALPLSVMCPEGKIVMANRAMRELLRYEFTDLVGRSMYDVVADPHEFKDRWDERLRGVPRVTPEQPLRLRTGDGTEITVRASSTLVTDSQGAIRYIVARAVPEPR